MNRHHRLHGLKATFWGVRGSLPTPARQYLGYGGNTPCVEVRTGAGAVLILDAGTGIRNLGLSLIQELPGRSIHLFLSHFHWDHLHGLPYFAPLFEEDFELFIYSALPVMQLQRLLENVMLPPHSPIAWNQTKSRKTYFELPGGPVTVCDATVTSFPLNHPQGASGYRIESAGTSVVYASDNDHGDAALDHILLAQAQQTGLLIYDAQYTPEQHETSRRGWGHSTWKQAAAVARLAEVERLVLFHHDPSHDDAMIERIAAAAAADFPHVEAAREGRSITLTRN